MRIMITMRKMLVVVEVVERLKKVVVIRNDAKMSSEHPRV